MRISTLQFHQQSLNAILDQQERTSKIREKVDNYKNINSPSDDPVQSATLLVLKQRLSQVETLKKNTDAAENRLQLEEVTLASMTDIIQRIEELQMQAGNSILGRSDRDAVLQEIIQLRDELVGLANSQDANGEYLFSGFKVNAKSFTQNNAGNYVYNGDDGQRFLQIESGIQIATLDSGFDLFVNIPNGNGTFKISDPGGNNTGTGVISPGSVVDISSYVPDTYTITFVTNSAGRLAYQVVGAASGQLIPALPAVTPANAPAFQEGQAINFNGIEVSVSGTPNVGDNFQIEPSTKQNLFDTINQMITALKLPNETNVQQAAATNLLSQNFAALEQGFDNLLNFRAQIGSRLNELDHARNLNEDFTVYTTKVINDIEGIDPVKAISELEFQSTILEIAQQSFVKFRTLSLFQFLG